MKPFKICSLERSEETWSWPYLWLEGSGCGQAVGGGDSRVMVPSRWEMGKGFRRGFGAVKVDIELVDLLIRRTILRRSCMEVLWGTQPLKHGSHPAPEMLGSCHHRSCGASHYTLMGTPSTSWRIKIGRTKILQDCIYHCVVFCRICVDILATRGKMQLCFI